LLTADKKTGYAGFFMGAWRVTVTDVKIAPWN
jgi:hypothetical protein